ncbi:MAG: hypothetical protein IKD68_01110 [Solobacterium sp.]|nr:hypothetical protein [Solobacterium sp.]
MNPLSIYQVFVRDYEGGTFADVEKDLDRIVSMGFNTLYLMPIHPIGVKGRKGTYGSPYAIRDYYAVEESLGGEEEFRSLLNAAHARGMKVFMDIVIHHTARDHRWVEEHPEYYMHDENGNILIAVEEWSDIYDLDFSCEALRDELIAMLNHWVKFGADGFRCDVASLVPYSFWERARKESLAINPDFIWLAESVHQELITDIRSRGLEAIGDGEASMIFDLLYPYDLWTEMMRAVEKKDLKVFQILLEFSLAEYRAEMRKVWCLENHDRERAASVIPDEVSLINWTAWSFLAMGVPFVYAGQEYEMKEKPDFFEKEPIHFPKKETELCRLMRKLNSLRLFHLEDVLAMKTFVNESAMEFAEYGKKRHYYGCFNVNHLDGEIPVHFEDGEYRNEISGETVIVRNGKLRAEDCPFFSVE